MRSILLLLSLATTLLAGCAAGAPEPPAADKAAAMGYHGPAVRTQRVTD